MDVNRQREAIIECNENGFTITAADSHRTSAAWSEVNAVVAYKRDLLIVDQICLGFVTANGTIEVNEEMQGWSELVERLPMLVPGTPQFSDWWERVAKPPFVASVTTLFSRQS